MKSNLYDFSFIPKWHKHNLQWTNFLIIFVAIHRNVLIRLTVACDILISMRIQHCFCNHTIIQKHNTTHHTSYIKLLKTRTFITMFLKNKQIFGQMIAKDDYYCVDQWLSIIAIDWCFHAHQFVWIFIIDASIRTIISE